MFIYLFKPFRKRVWEEGMQVFQAIKTRPRYLSNGQLFNVTCTRVFNFYRCKELTSSWGGRKTQNKVFQEKKERQIKRETECTSN